MGRAPEGAHERFVQGGGGLCFFLGDKIEPNAYNTMLFNEGKGLFPVPLFPVVPILGAGMCLILLRSILNNKNLIELVAWHQYE